MAEASEKIYDSNFYKAIKNASYISTKNLAPTIIEAIHPRQMVDVGCGVGAAAKAFQELGVDSYGIDGDYVDRSQLMIDEKKFFPRDLERRFGLHEKVDLVTTMEVAEHLSQARAVTFVEDLTKMSDVVLFSAAIPGQGGTNHINEQWQSYWQKIFEHFGFLAIDYIRPKFWNNPGVGLYYRQNMLLYVRESKLAQYPILFDFYLKHRETQIINKIHPDMYLNRTRLTIKLQNEIAELKKQE